LMIDDCIETHRSFGVVLIKRGLEALGPLPEPHLIGCTARITQVEQLDEGRMNIIAVGRKRFQVREFETDLPYLVGNVDNYPLDSRRPEEERHEARRLQGWIARYMDQLSEFEGLDLEPGQLPDDPRSLAYLGATLIQIPPEKKQAILATEQIVEMLESLRLLYRRELPLLRHMLETSVEDQGVFSLN